MKRFGMSCGGQPADNVVQAINSSGAMEPVVLFAFRPRISSTTVVLHADHDPHDSFLALFTSLGTLLCCALSSLLVFFGLAQRVPDHPCPGESGLAACGCIMQVKPDPSYAN
jgi:hypothetical protein